MKKSDCTRIGRILKPHGVKGELSVKFDPQWIRGRKFNKQKFLFIEIYYGDDELVPFFVEWAETDSNGLGRIKFEDFSRIESIRELANKEIYVPSEIYSPKIENIVSGNELLGFSVSDKNAGIIGIIEDVMENKSQRTLLIKNGEQEILIPLVKDFIVKVDKKGRIIHMMIPEGLTDINIHE